jgi:hypothetical protein
MSRAPERCFTRVGSGLTCKHYTRLERLARDKHSSLLQKFVTYGRKKFYNIVPRCRCHKPVFSSSLTLLQNKLEGLSMKRLNVIGLHHPLDGVTSPEYKLLRFKQLTKFSPKNRKH